MKKVQDDYLKECLSDVGPVPLDAFNMAWCRVCARRECVRAGLNNSVFDQRARNWKDTLFLKVPRAEDGDPRYANIRAKKFLPLASAAEVWTPTDLPPGPSPEPPSRTDPDEEVPDTDPNPVSPAEPAPFEPAPEPAGPTPEAPVFPVNTPFQQGSMIGGREPPPPVPPPAAPDGVLGEDSTYTFDDD